MFLASLSPLLPYSQADPTRAPAADRQKLTSNI